MARQLPSLKALRAFEAAARLQSFSKAAQELFVTHAAISRQIRSLEDWLGTRLFVRAGRGVVTTAAARAYQQTLTKLFDQLEAATRRIKNAATTQVTVQVDLAFATQWLVRRLGDFQRAQPGVEVSLDPTYEPFDSRGTDADLGIQFVDADVPTPKDARLLLHVDAFPVCSPAFLEGKPIRTASDLTAYPLLHEESRSWWAQWLALVGVPVTSPLKGPFFEETHLTLLAAEAGQGLALGDDALVADAIRAGRLVRVLDVQANSGSYYLVERPGLAEFAAGQVFADWLIRQCEAFENEGAHH